VLDFVELSDIYYSRTPLIRTLDIRIANYPDRLGLWGKFVENSTKLTCLEITGYRIKYSRVLRLLELQIRRGRKVSTQVHTRDELSYLAPLGSENISAPYFKQCFFRGGVYYPQTE